MLRRGLARVPPYHAADATAKGSLPPRGLLLPQGRQQGPQPQCSWISRKMHVWSRGQHTGMALWTRSATSPSGWHAGSVCPGGRGTELLSWQCRDQGTCWASSLELEGDPRRGPRA